MAKATHKGTCQICGAVHKVKANGIIAMHGYKAAGQYRGTCDGSYAVPYEKGTGALEVGMEWLARADGNEKRILEMARRILNWEAKELTPIGE